MEPLQPGTNLFTIMKDYIDNMLNEVSSRKAFILDEETLGIFAILNCLGFLSIVYSRSVILQREVYFIELINQLPQERLTHLKAIFFLRSSDYNVE